MSNLQARECYRTERSCVEGQAPVKSIQMIGRSRAPQVCSELRSVLPLQILGCWVVLIWWHQARAKLLPKNEIEAMRLGAADI